MRATKVAASAVSRSSGGETRRRIVDDLDLAQYAMKLRSGEIGVGAAVDRDKAAVKRTSSPREEGALVRGCGTARYGLRSRQAGAFGLAFASSIGIGKLTPGPYTPPPRPV